MLLDKFRDSVDVFNKSRVENGLDGDIIFNLQLNLRKISCLYKEHDVGLKYPDVWGVLLQLMRKVAEWLECDADVPCELEDCCKTALVGCFHGLMWDKSKGRMDGLRSKVDAYIMACREILVHSKSSNLPGEAFISLCDMSVVFGGGRDGHLFKFTETMVEDLIRYLEAYVFSNEDVEDTMEVTENMENQMEKLVIKR